MCKQISWWYSTFAVITVKTFNLDSLQDNAVISRGLNSNDYNHIQNNLVLAKGPSSPFDQQMVLPKDCIHSVILFWKWHQYDFQLFFFNEGWNCSEKKKLYILWISNSHTGYIPVLCCRGRTPQKMVISTWKYITGNKFSFTSVSVYYLQVLSEIHLKCSVKWGLRQLQQPHKAFTALVKQ